MNQIKFSHKYPKLWSQKSATLLLVKTINHTEVTEKLSDYDTIYSDDEMGIKQYPLPKTMLIHLTFLGNENIPFCTMRRYTLRKYEYYKSLVGEEFKITMTEV